MHPSLVRVQVKRGLGREPEEIFEKFTPEPFAAASLGQVHEATTREHKRVAVKIQYPGIRRTVEDDRSGSARLLNRRKLQDIFRKKPLTRWSSRCSRRQIIVPRLTT